MMQFCESNRGKEISIRGVIQMNREKTAQDFCGITEKRGVFTDFQEILRR